MKHMGMLASMLGDQGEEGGMERNPMMGGMAGGMDLTGLLGLLGGQAAKGGMGMARGLGGGGLGMGNGGNMAPILGILQLLMQMKHKGSPKPMMPQYAPNTNFPTTGGAREMAPRGDKPGLEQLMSMFGGRR